MPLLPKRAAREPVGTEEFETSQEATERKTSILAGVLVGALILVLGSLTLREGLARFAMMHTALYQQALQRASKHPAVLKSLGGPPDTGLFDIGGSASSEANSENRAKISIALTGPNGEGKLEVVGAQSPGGEPRYSRLYFIGPGGLGVNVLK